MDTDFYMMPALAENNIIRFLPFKLETRTITILSSQLCLFAVQEGWTSFGLYFPLAVGLIHLNVVHVHIPDGGPVTVDLHQPSYVCIRALFSESAFRVA